MVPGNRDSPAGPKPLQVFAENCAFHAIRWPGSGDPFRRGLRIRSVPRTDSSNIVIDHVHAPELQRRGPRPHSPRGGRRAALHFSVLLRLPRGRTAYQFGRFFACARTGNFQFAPPPRLRPHGPC